MKTTKRMMKAVQKIAAQNNLDLTVVGNSVKVEVAGYMPLTIEVIGKNQIAVSHYFIQEGDVMSDPEIVYFTGYGEAGWVPMSFRQNGLPFIVDRVYAWLNEDKTSISRIALKQSADLVSFSNLWASNLKAQGFIK